MKKVVIFLVVILCGCEMHFQSEIGDGFDLYYGDFGYIYDTEAISNYIYKNIEYVSDISTGHIDEWQSPELTDSIKQGDCDDKALLFINIGYIKLGNKYDLVGVQHDQYSRTIVGGNLPDHFLVYDRENDIYIEPNNNNVYYGIEIEYIYTFEELFPRAL